MKNRINYKKVLPYLVNKHKKFNNPIGDLCKDIIYDIHELEYQNPEWVFNYILNKCDNNVYINALEPFRGMYNRTVDNQLFKLYIDRKEGGYSYKGNIIHKIGDNILNEMIKYMEDSDNDK